jgi:SAM-dependent methyltransferase
VIPGLVDADLFNEHLARYRFAGRFPGVAALDIGCGSGYGTTGVGIDVSAEALVWARQHFPAARFLQASADRLPFADGSFDLLTAFEVIEHLERWPDLLSEAKRVLTPQGVLLVSTPNQSYYTEMRAKTGPNPFHVHEFEHAEFEAALHAVFPHVRIWAQNHADSIVFAPLNPSSAVLDAAGDSRPENAHFFVAACSCAPVDYAGLYAWLPDSGNVLRERERHIARLEGELAQKDEWLARLKDDLSALNREHEATLAEMEERRIWAIERERELDQRGDRILALQNEAAERLAWIEQLGFRISDLEDVAARAHEEIEQLNRDIEARTDWARDLERQLETRTEHVRIQAREIEEHKATVSALLGELATAQDRANAAAARIAQLEAERALIARSKWVRLGRSIRLGPVVK